MSADSNTSTDRTPRVKLWIPALLMAVVVGLIWSPNLLRPPPPAWTVYSNVKGQIRRIVMADKSVVRLNGASQVRIVYEDDDRRAAMGQAEAAFTMTPNAERPFLISSGDRVIEAEGGEINVLRETSPTGARTAVTVRQGRVRVYPPDRAAEGVAAGPGQQVSWTDGQEPVQVRAVNAANAFAWESHRLAYDRAPLAEVVADLNRYVARPIRIADPALGQLAYSGVLNLEGEDVMLRRIGSALPAEILLQWAQPRPARPARPKKPALVQSLLKLGAKPRPGARPAQKLPVPAPPKAAPRAP